MGEDRSAFAVFAKIATVEFEAFQKATSHYTAWNPIEDGMTFELGKTGLRAPDDVSGVYAIGEKINGTVKVMVWDATSQTVVAMMCSGVM